MGEPKQLLPWGRQTIIEQVVGTLAQAPLDEIVVVLGHRADEIRAPLARFESASTRRPLVRTTINPNYREGMLTSLQHGIAALDIGFRAAFVVLVDQPQMKAATLVRLRAEFERSGKGIVVPSHQLRRGHPLLLDLQKYRAEILAIDGAPGLQKVLRDHPDDILHVDFDDASVLADLDTRDEYERAKPDVGRPA